MLLSRRETLKLAAGATVLPVGPSRAANPIPLRVNLLGYGLGIHMPTTAALFEGMPRLGYAPEAHRIEQMQTLTQTLVAGTVDLGEADPITTLSAAEAGADLKVIGLWYRSTDLVFVVDANRVRTLEDLTNPRNLTAVNNKGDISDVMLIGVLLKHGLDPDKVQLAEIGGSGARVHGLLAGRVQAVAVHLDQAADLAKHGDFQILFKPWIELPGWVNELWVTRASWLNNKANQRIVVELLKSEMACFRQASADLNWFVSVYQKYATVPDAKTATAEALGPLWRGLVEQVNPWPPVIEMRIEDFRSLIPLYKKAGVIKGTVKLENVIEPSLLQQAVSELG